MVGPTFVAPEAPHADGYLPSSIREEIPPDAAALPSEDFKEAQTFHLGALLPSAWWRLLGSDALDALVVRVLRDHPSIAAQQAALEQSREAVVAARGALLPTAAVGLNGERATLNQYGVATQQYGNVTANYYSTSFNISYILDLFGGERRTLEGTHAQQEYERYALKATTLSLAGDVAAAAVTLASLRAQIATSNEILVAEEAQLSTISRRLQLGSLTETDVLQQQTEVAATRATLPTLQQQLSAAQHQLAALTNHLPSEVPAFRFDLTDFSLPHELPVALPSDLVAQRPDILEAQATLHRANAQIGVAEAAMLPSITLGAAYGSSATQFSQLFNASEAGWNILGTLSAPVFHGGTLNAQRRAAVAARDQAAAQYRLVVINAFQNVADALTQIQHDRDALVAVDEQTRLAKASLDFASKRYAVGALDYASLLAAQRTYQQARLDSVRLTADRLLDTITLFVAVGGGWNEGAVATAGSSGQR